MSDRRSITSRENAKKSTGPKTAAGKAAASLNAMKHGLYTETTLVDGEDEADLVAFGKRMRADLAPVGELELMLVDRIISTAWRVRRAIDIEGAVFENEERGWHLAFHSDRIIRLNRYETSLERTMHKALHELQRLQAARRGDPVKPPEVLDVTVDAGDAPLSEPVARSVAVASFRQNRSEVEGDYPASQAQ